VWKRKTRDLMDYHEGALEAIDGKITKPEPLEEKANAAQQKQYNIELDYYRKADSYAKSMITAKDIVYQKIMNKEKKTCQCYNYNSV
jgi:hypothetical protein